MKYNIFEPWKTLDPWQLKYINQSGNCFLLCCRQSGKTTAMSIKFGKRAALNPKRIIGMFAYTEKQAYNLFFMTLMYLKAVYPKQVILKGAKKPTKHIIHLKNGSKIMCYAVGLAGEGIRTFTLTDLVIDEAAMMAREVFVALTPMLSITKGSLDISSTPRGRQGYFYKCSDDPLLGAKIKKNFSRFYVSHEDCPRHDEEFLASERIAMTELEFAQEYKAVFLDEYRQLIPDALIRSCMTMKKPKASYQTPVLVHGDLFLGVDIAAQGRDQTVLFSVSRVEKKLRQIEMQITTKTRLTDTIRAILSADSRFDYKKIYCDSGGLGTGVTHPLLEHEQVRRKVVEINNASRDVEYDGTKSKRLLKIDLYANLLRLMEQHKIQFFKDPEIMLSLKSVQCVEEGGRTKIFGNYTHIAEAIIRAAWCMKEKSLNLWCR